MGIKNVLHGFKKGLSSFSHSIGKDIKKGGHLAAKVTTAVYNDTKSAISGGFKAGVGLAEKAIQAPVDILNAPIKALTGVASSPTSLITLAAIGIFAFALLR